MGPSPGQRAWQRTRLGKGLLSYEPWSPTSGHLDPQGEASSLLRPEVVTYDGGVVSGLGDHR